MNLNYLSIIVLALCILFSYSKSWGQTQIFEENPDAMFELYQFRQHGTFYYQTLALELTEQNAYVGRKNDDPAKDWESYRMVYAWDISSIPENAQIHGAQLTFDLRITSNADPEVVENIIYRVKANSPQPGETPEQQWVRIRTAPTFHERAFYPDQYGQNLIDSQSFSGSHAFSDSIRARLSDGLFSIAVMTSDDENWGTGRGTRHFLNLRRDNLAVNAVELYIQWSPPAVHTVTVENSFGEGDVIVNGQAYPSGTQFQWEAGSSHTLEANEYHEFDDNGFTRVHDFERWRKGEDDNFPEQQNPISIEIDGDDTYTARFKTELHVTSDYTVLSGQTLTFDEGTTVYFHPGTRLTVNGKLIANGTPSNRITIRSLLDDPGS